MLLPQEVSCLSAGYYTSLKRCVIGSSRAIGMQLSLWLLFRGLRFSARRSGRDYDRCVECADEAGTAVAHTQAKQILSWGKLKRLPAGKGLLHYALVFLWLKRRDHGIAERLY